MRWVPHLIDPPHLIDLQELLALIPYEQRRQPGTTNRTPSTNDPYAEGNKATKGAGRPGLAQSLSCSGERETNPPLGQKE